jgi:hydroxymethylpyrimidine/phosphomethylpyrimidine kinase
LTDADGDPSNQTPPVALTIAGSDSGGGAGIQADLTTFAALGVHGTSAITALTAQNTHAVTQVHVPPVAMLEAQLEAVISDLPVTAVKTGMLATIEVMKTVADWAAAGRLPNLVVDPVLVSSAGDRLFAEPAGATYIELLVPHALIATPNAREAAALLGQPIDAVRTLDDQRAAAVDLGLQAREAARASGAPGPQWVVIKGGHLPGAGAGQAVDIAHEIATGAVHELNAPWLDTGNDHGTGCTFAAATTAHLALGHAPLDALHAAKAFVHAGLRRSATWHLGAGHGPVAHTAR